MVALLRRFNGFDPSDLLDKSLDAVATVANDLSAKIESLRDEVNAKIAGLSMRIDLLHKLVEKNKSRDVIDALTEYLVRNNSSLRIDVDKIKKLMEAKKTLNDNGRKDIALKLEEDIEKLRQHLRREILLALVKLIEEKLIN